MRVSIAALAALLLVGAAPAFAQQPPVSIFSGKVKPLGYCQLTNLAASTQLSACTGGVPAGSNFVVVIVEAQAIRYRSDGVAPTATVGMPIAVGSMMAFALTNLTALRMIESVAGAIANVEFFQ